MFQCHGMLLQHVIFLKIYFLYLQFQLYLKILKYLHRFYLEHIQSYLRMEIEFGLNFLDLDDMSTPYVSLNPVSFDHSKSLLL